MEKPKKAWRDDPYKRKGRPKKELIDDPIPEGTYIDLSTLMVKQSPNDGMSFDDGSYVTLRVLADGHTQTGISMWDLKLSEEGLSQATNEICELKKKIGCLIMNEEALTGDIDRTKYYTGLPGMMTLSALTQLIGPQTDLPRSLTPYQMVLMTLMKLRLNFPLKDLAYRFNIMPSSASKLYTSSVDLLYEKLYCLIQIPDRSTLLESVPNCCLEKTSLKDGHLCLSFEPFEVQVYQSSETNVSEKFNPCSTEVRKYIVGVLPHGVIAFLFKDETGGRVTHEHLHGGGILEQLLDGDIIIARNGFDTNEETVVNAVEVVSLPDSEKQLSAVSNYKNYRHFRLHTMRVASIVKGKYNILSGPIFREKFVENYSDHVDKLVWLCCALTNLSYMPMPKFEEDNE